MITLCWAAKGGSGTTVVTATLGLAATRPTLLIDLAGDLASAFGIGDPDGPGLGDWLGSDAPADRIDRLITPLTDTLGLLHRGAGSSPVNWDRLARALATRGGDVVIDAGTGVPAHVLRQQADRSWLVTRACYLSVRRAIAQPVRPDGVVLVEEPGRALGADDVAASIGAPVVARVLLDPAVARAVDSGLLLARLPRLHRKVFEMADEVAA